MAKNNRKPLTDEERAARRERDRKLAQDAVDRLASSDGWKAFLRTRAAFRRYSLNNQLLIALQRSDATRVAGFRRWRTLGYSVRKGETALYIWQPVPPSKKQIEAWREAGADPKEKPRVRFKLGPVFAREQVDPLPAPAVPAPLDPPIADLEGEDLAEAWIPLTAIAAAIGVTVEVTDRIPGDGRYTPDAKAIQVRDGLSVNQQVVALVHELAHALVREDKQEGDPPLTYAREELVAESVAYIVASGLGFDSSANSIPYLAAYAEQTGPEAWALIASLTDRLAGRIEEALHTPETPEGQPAPTSPDAQAVDRMDPAGPRGFVAREGGPLRATRIQAQHDQRAAA
ncbi:hypothetical protein GKE82_26015 [Conexibacter sp. W3-3-2]|uniref:ArdC-like ssDNA-binding domain-containing protein n=1 Tax=Conexibacter sp. W3-3-2 TaxID=2675227 RepID=UPI0012B71FC0|nr:ArdC-like ssDNA-binding domain-containing protein [Conexibacter sp. W3-3-2]MTD47661.1 hypothetical protein [Conexibacter sp. W3-3-2]